ncbi:MAG TPA: M20 family metallopeptidase [bacterium]|nr:M20 family metallopeptidase [bacterium]
MDDLNALKDRVCHEVDGLRDDLGALSRRIFEHPEFQFEERQACAWLSEFLKANGFDVETNVAGMETAFRGRVRGTKERPHVALLAEYDALRGLGHACGHNLICTASVGAAVALHRAAPSLAGVLSVLGTPAEEGGGGKVIMAEQGVFGTMDAVMMFHPSRANWWARGALASRRLTIKFHGKSSHAAAMPERGVNALNALMLTFHAIDSLRQHVTSDVRIHGIITRGGDAPNVVPEFAEARFSVRAATRAAMEEVLVKVKRCAEGAAIATGASVEMDTGVTYAERNNNPALVRFFGENLARLGVPGEEPPRMGGVGSSDIGNVSMICPTIHPYLAIGDGDLAGHTPEFREAAGSERGRQAMMNAAKGLAMTTLDVMYRPGAADEAWKAFKADVAAAN